LSARRAEEGQLARRYVNPNRAVPSSPDEFAEEIWDLSWSGHFGPERLIQAYASKMAGDREIRGQLGSQLGVSPRRCSGR
jgi:hypothetical protein